MPDDDEPLDSFTIKCLGCGKSLTVSGESEDELRARLGTSEWRMGRIGGDG